MNTDGGSFRSPLSFRLVAWHKLALTAVIGRMNSVLGAQPPPLLPPPLRDGGEEMWRGIACATRPPAVRGRFPTASLNLYF